jgi:hypothetical protein
LDYPAEFNLNHLSIFSSKVQYMGLLAIIDLSYRRDIYADRSTDYQYYQRQTQKPHLPDNETALNENDTQAEQLQQKGGC